MKYFYFIIGLLVALFVINWSFNHINAWVGVLLGIVLLGILINIIIKKTKE